MDLKRVLHLLRIVTFEVKVGKVCKSLNVCIMVTNTIHVESVNDVETKGFMSSLIKQQKS